MIQFHIGHLGVGDSMVIESLNRWVLYSSCIGIGISLDTREIVP